MKASILDLRRNMKSIIAAIGRNEKVTLTCRGRRKAVIVPCQTQDREAKYIPVSKHPAFGIWAERGELDDVEGFVRDLRKGRGV